MGPIGEQELDRQDSPFHKNLVGNVDGLIRHMEGMLSLLEDREGGEGEDGKDDHASNTTTTTMTTTARTTDATLLWNKTTETFNTVLGGLQTFVTGLRFQYSSLDREAEELEALKKSLEGERDVMTEQGHELHCRIQYNNLEMKLDQSFRDTERCSSVESARCFKEEAHENLRRTQEIIRTANLRNCQLDMDIFNEMERITTTFHEYRKERDTYVAELDLFDDVRRRKVYDWMKDPIRNGAERDLGENIIEYLELTSCRRHLEPKIIGNTLRMQSMNESLAFDRQDNLKRLEEMTGLQKRIDDLTGLNNVMPRTTPASTDLAMTVQGPLSNVSDFRSSDFLDKQEQEVERHASSGHGLHRCPRKMNLATDPITDPELRQELESALRWEDNDGVPLPVSTSTAAVDADADASGVGGEETSNSDPDTVTGSRDPVTDGGTCTTTSEDLQDPASVICSSRRLVENPPENQRNNEEVEKGNNEVRGREGCGSATSLCGDALLPSREKLAPSDTDNEMTGNHHLINRSHSPNNPRVTVTGAAIIINNNVAASGVAAANTAATAEVSMPRSSHLLLHHVESATGTTGSSCQENLMFGLVKKKSNGGPSSMTAIVDSEKEAGGGGGGGSGRMTSQANRMAAADDRETRSQGWTPSGGRAGCSGTNANSGNPRN